MRNLHLVIGTEFGRESVAILRKWEHLEKKIANFKNHRQFTLRCLSQRITPNSLKLRSNIKTTRGKSILERAKRQLANERVRNINNTIQTCSWQRDTWMEDLKRQISNFYYKECEQFIERVREWRHQSVLDRQLSKSEQLWQRIRGGCSNNKSGCSKTQHQNNNSTVAIDDIIETTTSTTNNAFTVTSDTGSTATTTTTATTTGMATTNDYVRKWVKNLSGTPLTEAQVSLLVHGPNFAIASSTPFMGNTSQL